MQIKHIIKEEWAEGSWDKDLNGVKLIDAQTGMRPLYGYRVMHHKEWEQAEQTGFFEPSKFYKRIHISAEPIISYRDNSEKHYVVRFRINPKHGWQAKTASDGEVYGVTWERVPFKMGTIEQEI